MSHFVMSGQQPAELSPNLSFLCCSYAMKLSTCWGFTMPNNLDGHYKNRILAPTRVLGEYQYCPLIVCGYFFSP